MRDHLLQPTVLVLNRNWQAINIHTPAEAICQMMTDTATGLDIDGEKMIPVRWCDWLKLPIREQDDHIQTVRGPVRIPTVLVLCTYAKVPMRKPSLSLRAIAERDNWTCQYTGQRLHPREASIDHILPRSRGGKTSWENCVLTSRKINTRKADRLPHEVGLRLLRTPSEPKPRPVTMFLRNHAGIVDWEPFLTAAG